MTDTWTGGAGDTGTETGMASEVAGAVKEHASEVASAGGAGVQRVASTARNETSAVLGDVKSQARRVVGETTTQLRQQGDEQLRRLAGTIGQLSHELRRMGDAGGDGPAAGFASEAAAFLDGFGGRLVDGGLDGTVAEVKRFARNRPVVFLAAAVGAGFLAGRLVRNVDTERLTGSQDDVDTPSLPVATPTPTLTLSGAPSPGTLPASPTGLRPDAGIG
jgi:hypothetical protein